MTQTLNITAARSSLGELVNHVYHKKTRVYITKAGISAAAILSTAEVERLDAYDEQHAQDFAEIAQVQAAFKDVPVLEHERQVERAVAEARARRASQASQGADLQA